MCHSHTGQTVSYQRGDCSGRQEGDLARRQGVHTAGRGLPMGAAKDFGCSGMFFKIQKHGRGSAVNGPACIPLVPHLYPTCIPVVPLVCTSTRLLKNPKSLVFFCLGIETHTVCRHPSMPHTVCRRDVRDKAKVATLAEILAKIQFYFSPNFK